MSAKRDKQLREQSLVFFAKTVAGQGHEITNVLNVINELTGLVQDLLAGADRGRELDVERFKSVCEKVQFQVQRGENIVRQVRYFAHNADVPVSVFDLKTVIEQVVFLAERHTRLNKSELVSDFPGQSATLECSPFELQHAVFLSIEAALLTSTLPERIVVGYRIEEKRALLFVKSDVVYNSEPAPEERVAFLRELLQELKSELTQAPQAGQVFNIGFSLNKATPPKNKMADFTEK